MADALKEEGNKAFKDQHFTLAVDLYSRAIELDPTSAVLYCNRSFAQFKLENYGFSEADAAKAIEIDPTFVKGYYRRGSALYAMGKLKDAIKALKTCSIRVPSDATVKTKLAQAKKELRAIKFAECIESNASHQAIDLSSIEVPATYEGPSFPEVVTTEWVQELMVYLKDQNKLHKKYVIEMLLKAKQLLSRLRSLVDITVPPDNEFTICGDVHGQYYDLLNIFNVNGLPSPNNPYLFNGDFVDRGSFSVEIILVLLAWKLAYPEHFHLLRGNHETKNMNKIYGFEGEVMHKYDAPTMELFSQLFCELPLCAVINQRVMVLHGGLFSKDGVTLDDIRKIDRVREPPESGLMCEALWSDPCKMNGRHPSKRGVGLMFGPDVAARFLDANGLSVLVRSHEMKEEGYEVEADGRVVTIFSAPNYCDQMGNKGALIRLQGNDNSLRYIQFNAVPHPNVPTMAYARSFF